jgi:acyl carrier protein
MSDFRKEIARIVNVGSVDETFNLRENADSMARVEIIMAAEAILGAEISNADIKSIITVGDLERLMGK